MEKWIRIFVACMCLIAVIRGINNAIERSRANEYKEKCRIEFLDKHNRNMSSSQWNDVAPQHVMEWDEEAKQWYIPADANRNYWKKQNKNF